MTLSETRASLNQIRRTAPRFQQTFCLKDWKRSVATIVSAGEIQGGCLTIDQVVFEPTHLIELLNRYSIPARYGRGLSLTAVGQDEVQMLLHAAFRDGMDFVFFPNPKSFVMYADHDDFTTFYAQTRSSLNRIAKALLDQELGTIQHYERRL
jgi:hypothetical protein